MHVLQVVQALPAGACAKAGLAVLQVLKPDNVKNKTEVSGSVSFL